MLLASASLYTATVRTPIKRAVRITRHAISPRFATRIYHGYARAAARSRKTNVGPARAFARRPQGRRLADFYKIYKKARDHCNLNGARPAARPLPPRAGHGDVCTTPRRAHACAGRGLPTLSNMRGVLSAVTCGRGEGGGWGASGGALLTFSLALLVVRLAAATYRRRWESSLAAAGRSLPWRGPGGGSQVRGATRGGARGGHGGRAAWRARSTSRMSLPGYIVDLIADLMKGKSDGRGGNRCMEFDRKSLGNPSRFGNHIEIACTCRNSKVTDKSQRITHVAVKEAVCDVRVSLIISFR